MQSRKYLNNMLFNIKYLKNKYEYAAKDIIRVTQDEYEQTIHHYDKLIANLTKELMSLSIGYNRYTRTFYIKNSYNIPATFIEYEGLVFIRENLVSWQNREGVRVSRSILSSQHLQRTS